MKHPSENSSQEVLGGLVERVTYHNVENGFCVLRAKARGHRDVVPATGANTYPQPQPARQRPLLGTFEMGRSAASPAQQHTADAIHRRRDRPCGRPVHLNTGSARAGDGLVRGPDWQGELEQRPVFAVR